MAGNVFKSIFRKLCALVTIVCCVSYGITCLVPYLTPSTWWFVGFLGLAFPYQAVVLVFLIIFWLIAKPRWALLPIVTLLAGYQQLMVVFAVRPHSFVADKAPGTIRIVDWNVGNMYGLSSSADKRKHNRTEIAGAILKLNPDIICLQEFNHSATQGPQANNIALFDSLYPYHFFSKDVDKNKGFYQYGSIIFSKMPIVNSERIAYPLNSYESLIYTDLMLKPGDTFRVYTSHLQSFKFSSEDYADLEKIKDQDNETVEASRNIVVKMKAAFRRRATQANTVHNALAKCHYRSIICGDFNDVPNSYAYFTIRGLRQDAFLQKDFGIGKSFNALAPTLRIDYILPDTTFKVHQFDMVDEGLSDHYMLVSDVSFK